MLEFKKSDPQVASIVKSAYPDYRGRRPIKVIGREQYLVLDYWSEGSRTYARFYHIPTRRFIQASQMGFEQQKQGNPFNLMIGHVKLSPETAVIENSIFRGKCSGVRIILHPDTYAEWAGE